MSTQPSTESRKQPPSVYTVMLFLSMLFMIVAVVAMAVERNRWAPEYYSTQSADPQVFVMPVNPDVFV